MSLKKRSFLQIIFALCLYLAIAFAVSLLALNWLMSNQSLSFQTFVIQSGSMEPSIMTGDIIVIQPSGEYQAGDVVTFEDSSQRVVTHRILEVEDSVEAQTFITKGDANQSTDAHPINFEDIKGKVNFVIPKLVFAVAFAQTKQGMLMLILVPVILLIYDEIRKILIEFKK